MSANAITLIDFAEEVVIRTGIVLPEIRPAGRAMIEEYLDGLRTAALIGNTMAFARYVSLIEQQMELERIARERST
jgi:hypothetical protein